MEAPRQMIADYLNQNRGNQNRLRIGYMKPETVWESMRVYRNDLVAVSVSITMGNEVHGSPWECMGTSKNG